MRFEAEVIAEELLPAVRSIIATRLSKDYGLTQEEIASRLRITQPAVSQYLNGSRASDQVIDSLRSDPQVDILLDDAAGKAARDNDFSDEISRIVENVRDKGILKQKFGDAKRL